MNHFAWNIGYHVEWGDQSHAKVLPYSPDKGKDFLQLQVFTLLLANSPLASLADRDRKSLHRYSRPNNHISNRYNVSKHSSSSQHDTPDVQRELTHCCPVLSPCAIRASQLKEEDMKECLVLVIASRLPPSLRRS